MDARTFPRITPQDFSRIRFLLESNGMEVSPGSQGTIRHAKHGIDLGFKYNEVSHELTLTIEKKPFLIPSSAIWNEVQKSFEKHMPG